jgi:hypothetical protein
VAYHEAFFGDLAIASRDPGPSPTTSSTSSSITGAPPDDLSVAVYDSGQVVGVHGPIARNRA